VNDLDLSTRLHDLAEEFAGPADGVAPETTIARYRRRRRTRAGLVATVAAVVAIAVGVPTAIGSLSSEGEVAVPTPSVSTTTAAPTTVPTTSRSATPTTAPTRSTRPADTSPEPAHVAELQQVAAGLPAATLTAPTLWDQWLPDGRPYPQSSIDEDAATCPRLSARLAEVIGQQMSYWTGTLPGYGCTWVETPLDAVNNVYDYAVTVAFYADGTTVDELRRSREGPGQGTHPCPSLDLPSVSEGALILRCDVTHVATTSYALAVPDARVDGGLWVLSVSVKDAAPVRPAAILPVLLEGVADAFG
jgi:hypothetical protein